VSAAELQSDEQESNTLVHLNAIATALAEAKTIEELLVIRAQAEAIRVWAKKASRSIDNARLIVNHAAEYKIRAERRLGQELARMPKHPGGRPQKTGDNMSPVSSTPTLEDLDIHKKQSERVQAIARVPDEVFEKRVAEVKASEVDELTSREFVRLGKREAAKEKPAVPPLAGKYRVFYVDPPWRYDSSGMTDYGAAEAHYPTMSVDELCALPVRDHAEDQAVLFLWVTSPFLEDSFKVIRAWGFEYRASFIWDKVKHNYGHYNSVRHELLLVAVRGSCVPDEPKLFDSVQSIERTKHSEKPERFREIIDTLYTTGERVELFARTPTPGWTVWGNEA